MNGNHVGNHVPDYTLTRTRNKKLLSSWQHWWRKISIVYQLKATDFPFLSIFLGIGLYLLFKQPLVLAIGGVASAVGISVYQIAQSIPHLEKWIGIRIRFWHIVSIIGAITLVFGGVFEQPAHAIFLSGLENFFVELSSQSGDVGGGEGIQEDTINLVFNVIRGIFVLLVAVAALFAYNQAQQGNDWRPIATQVGLAFGVILTIDVITFLFIGDGTTTG